MIYDCLMFNDELDLLEIRLNHHFFVDSFIIIECTRTFSGNTKPLYFELNKNRFKKFSEKINHIIVDFPYFTNENWSYEHLQRNVLKGFSFMPEDILIYSDCDEIIRDEDVVKSFITMNKPIISMQMDLCFYYLNLRVRNVSVKHENYHLNSCFNSKWHMGKLLKASLLPDFKNLYEIRQFEIDNPTCIENAGWHFSNLGSAERIFSKLKAISHSNDREFQDISINKINDRKQKLIDPLGRDGVIYETFTDLPQYILNHKEKFSEYFIA